MMLLLAFVFMPIERLSEIFDFYRFGLGSLIYCVNQMRQILDRLGFQKGVEYADEAKRLLDEAVDKKYAWNQKKTREPLKRREGARALDDKIDQTLSAIVQGLETFTRLPEGAEQRQLAEEIIDDLFPEGVFPITSEEFGIQNKLVDKAVTRLRTDYQSHIDTLSLGKLVDQLEELNDEFGDLLEPDREGVEYDEVQAAHTEAEDAFHRLVAVVAGEYADDLETFNEVMMPVVEQTEKTRRHMKRRSTLPEVDPETGEPVEPDNEPPTDGGSPEGDSPTDGGSGDGDSPTDGGSSETDETDGENSEN